MTQDMLSAPLAAPDAGATLPCFVAGTPILTPSGPRPVETLRPGDRVLTRDAGAQPLVWVGARQVAAQGAQAPIEIAAETFGPHARLRVSAQHRILIRDPLAELLFGTPEVLIAARDLIDGQSVRRIAGGTATYVHLAFRTHHIVMSAGLASESFRPGPAVLAGMAAADRAALLALFPGADRVAAFRPARPLLRAHEARVLLAAATDRRAPRPEPAPTPAPPPAQAA